MKKYVFEITITEQDLAGDEFFEEAIEVDGTGIAVLTQSIRGAIIDSNLLDEGSNFLKLKSYKDE